MGQRVKYSKKGRFSRRFNTDVLGLSTKRVGLVVNNPYAGFRLRHKSCAGRFFSNKIKTGLKYVYVSSVKGLYKRGWMFRFLYFKNRRFLLKRKVKKRVRIIPKRIKKKYIVKKSKKA